MVIVCTVVLFSNIELRHVEEWMINARARRGWLFRTRI